MTDTDGKTGGLQGFMEPKEKELIDCEKRSVVESEAVEAEEIVVERDDLNTDQKYLKEIYDAIKW